MKCKTRIISLDLETTGIIPGKNVPISIGAVKLDADLINQLREAVEHLSASSDATKPIFKFDRMVGYGVDKSQRSIAADSVMSIVRAIKSQGGW